MGEPRPGWRDHLQVAGLLGLTLLGLLPPLLTVLVAPFVRPLIRAYFRRRLRGEPPPPAAVRPPDPGAWAGREVFLVAGEASGDRLAEPVVRRLLSRCPDLRVRGYGGPASARAGARLDLDLVARAVLGPGAVIRSLGFWWRLCARTVARLRVAPPDVFLTIDFPGLNGRLARWARRRGVPAVHLVAPAVWAYMPWRLLRWWRAVDRLLTTFPHEPLLLRGGGLKSLFVGHPLFEAPLPPPRTPETWPGEGPCVVELLPGSRRHEVERHAPTLLEAAAEIERALPRAAFRVCVAEAEHAGIFERAGRGAPRRPRILEVEVKGTPREGGEGPALLGALAASGTVTAELAADLVPMAVFYRVSAFLRVWAWIGLTAPWIALANLVAGRAVVPERLQVRASGRRLARDFLAVAGTAAAWERVREGLGIVRRRLAIPDVADRAASAVLEGWTLSPGRRAAVP